MIGYERIIVFLRKVLIVTDRIDIRSIKSPYNYTINRNCIIASP